jgi:predicted MPP superfamily phosphohydrolase
MRIITYSDLHLEFGSGWMLRLAVNGDVMILAGDIVTLRDYEPLDQILRKWKKAVLYVTGNHEYYTRRPMNEEDNRFKAWLEDRHPHVKLLLHEEVSIGGVNFFGGTMWTDFNGGALHAMETARSQMNDYRQSITLTKRLSRQQIRLCYIKTSRRNCWTGLARI